MEGLESISPRPGAQAPSRQEEEAKQAKEDQMRRDLLTTILDTAARERLSRIALVSQDRSKQIESILLRMAQGGQLRGRVTEAQLIDLLDQMETASGSKASSKIVYRRKGADDDFDI